MFDVRREEQSEVATTIGRRSRERWGDTAATVIIGRHATLTDALDRLERFAGADSPVLVTGETGTGKELFARGLYLLSRRNGRPFHRVNCAQYQESQLVASELFGHRRGSFTGAVGDHVGLFESAHTGVLFLDEVTELSSAAQAMLLRVLSEGELVPVGETLPKRVDVRVVAASSADVAGLVRSGRFRLDLYHRLRGLQLRVPAVRERGGDWELIRDYYLRQLTLSRTRPKRFSRASLDLMGRYPWPGNVRELKAVVDTAFHLSEGELIEPSAFVESLEDAARVGQFAKVPVLDVEEQCYARMTARQADFWQVVHDPYLDRELSRSQVQAIVARGLTASRGSYKRLLPLFGMPPGDYLRFMDFLRHHNLKPGTAPEPRTARPRRAPALPEDATG